MIQYAEAKGSASHRAARYEETRSTSSRVFAFGDPRSKWERRVYQRASAIEHQIEGA